MTRTTLKITKPVDPATQPKALTSRAMRALRDKRPAASTAPPRRFHGTSGRACEHVAAAGGARRWKQRAAEGGRRTPKDERAGRTSRSVDVHGVESRWEVPANPSSRRRRAPGAAPAAGTADRTKPAYTPRGTPKFGTRAKPAPGAKLQSAFEPRQSSSPHTKRTSSATASPQRKKSASAQTRAPRHENPDDPRLSKRMSELGLCSRREADDWIENGWVKVDGQVVTTLGVRVSPHARIDIDRAAAHHQSELVTILLNKPIGYVSGQAEDGHTPAMALIKPENRWADDASPTRFKPGHLRGLAPAGRLDIDSTGLIVFTQDGRIAKNLIGRDSAVEKEYLVRVEGSLPDQAMKLLQRGLELDGVKLRPARVSWQNDDQLRFVLREGRKRQIRRMCELVGLAVTGLKRVCSGGVSLGPLPVGQWRYLRRDEKF